MVPKKAKDFKKEVAEELGLPVNVVSDFIDFYWERVRKLMTGLDHEMIQIPNLGTFKVKHWKIAETTEKHKATILRVEGKFMGYKIKVDLTDRIEKLERIKGLVAQREVKFKEIRDAREAKNNLEEQNPNTSGSMEQDL